MKKIYENCDELSLEQIVVDKASYKYTMIIEIKAPGTNFEDY